MQGDPFVELNVLPTKALEEVLYIKAGCQFESFLRFD
jgi:hypothetical protein